DGSCKAPHTWHHEVNSLIATIAPLGLPQHQTVIKIFSTTDCDALMHLIPVARATGIKLWAKMWTGGPSQFHREREGLHRALQTFPNAIEWLAGISVGSEHLFRGEIAAPDLRKQICDVKRMVQNEFGLVGIPVGTADSDVSLVKLANHEVLHAADIVHLNIYPFWNRHHVSGSLDVIASVLTSVRGILADDPEKIIAVGETGWPSCGAANGAAVPGVDNAKQYWREVGCWLHRAQVPWAWFSGVDEPSKPDMGGCAGVEKNWGVLT
ncbi:glycoside hydrolase superfamily, partial [Kalaharituber pfeilii]